mmetsp:Transcript_16587/g.27078  ORF Transcript_16587/g.27078 Transcript_16587/m.27078 type:complete len:1028 (+) Transcript_16587:56-3139(+)
MIMMASASSGSGLENHDHAHNMMFAPPAVSTDDNIGNDNNLLRRLEEGRRDKLKTDSSNRSQQEAVALRAFNEACSSRTHSSSSSASAVLLATPSHKGINRHRGGTNIDSPPQQKPEAPISKSTQLSPGSSPNTPDDNEDEVSLDPEDLQNPGGYEDSMSINDLLTESPPQPKNNNSQRTNSSSDQFDGGGKNSFNRNSNSINIRQAGNNDKKSSNSNNIKMAARIRHASSVTSTGSSSSISNQHKFMSSLSGLFQPISKRKRREEQHHQHDQMQQRKATPPFSSSASFDHKSFGLIRNNNRKQKQRLREQHHDSSNHNNSWKGSSAFSINTCNSKDTSTSNSILNPMKKKHSRVSWQLRDGDLDKELLSFGTTAAAGAGSGSSKPSYLNNDNHAATKRNSSWTVTDLECLTNSPIIPGGGDDSGGCEGDDASSLLQIGASSIRSNLTPEEQQLWASMLQLANLSTATAPTATLNEGGGDHDGDTVGALEESPSLTKTKSVQDAMNLAAAAILQTDAAAARFGECDVAVGDAPDGSRVEDMALGRKGEDSDEPIEGLPNQSQPPVPLSQPSPPLSTEITPATAVTVTTLAYQEVEEYRERLRRKREEMEGIDYSDSQQQQESSPTELNDLNALLMENATNINNAVLLQRALYALRIHRGSLMDNNTVIDTSNNSVNNSVNVDESDRRTSFSRFSRSEHSGLDQLALNHLISISSSMRSSGTGGSGRTSSLRTAAQAAAASVSRSQPPSPSASIYAPQRRHTETYAQVGAHHQNEPAPLLFRRTFGNPNRREQRRASRRATINALHSQRRSNTTDSGSSAGNQQDQQAQQHQPQPDHRRISSLDSGAGSTTDSNSDHQSNSDESENMDEEFANTLEYPPSHNDAQENSIAARVTPYNADEGYNRRHLGTLLESTQSQQSTSSLVSNPRTALLTAQASVRRQSLRALQMIQAVLVSDEVIEPVEAEQITASLFPHDLEGMDMLEELLEEKEEEVRMIEHRYRRRERVWMVAVAILVVAVIVLVVTAVRR